MADVEPLTRNELAKFLPSQRAIKAFENLFTTPAQVNTNTADVETATFVADSAKADAASAIATLNEVQTALQGLLLAPPSVDPRPNRYGMFLSTATQTAALANTAYGVTFNQTYISSGVKIGSPSSQILVGTDGVYVFNYSIQLDKTTSPVGLFWCWARINGVDVPDSASQVRIQGNNAEVLVSRAYAFKLSAGDYMELMWAADSTTTQLTYSAASGVVPAIPSVILTVTDHD